MPKCTYCNKQYSEHRGVIIVDSVTSKIRYFCSSKCRKYFNMQRKKGKWAMSK